MSSDAYFAGGRGGAGNFYSNQEIADQMKAAKGDLEAQKPNTASLSYVAAAAASVPGTYARSGRGGAGNFYEPSVKAKLEVLEEAAADGVRQEILSCRSHHKPVHSGRGGAGNWFEPLAYKAPINEDEERRKQDLEKSIARQVEAGLMAPQAAHVVRREGN